MLTSILTGINVSVTKTGNGILMLSGTNEFTGGLTVSAGGVLLGGNSTPTQGGNGLLGGPLGTGTVTMAATTRLLINNGDRQVGNNILFQGTPTFDLNDSGTMRTMTLNGAITGLPDGTPSIQINSPFLTVALLGTIPNIANITAFNRTGPGRLIFNATGYTGNFDATALGFATAVSLLHDGTGNGAPQAIVLPTGNVLFDAGIVPNITVGRAGGTLPYGQASNKTIQPASISNLNLGLFVTNNNGYGLVVADAFTANAGSLYSVLTTSFSGQTQGLTLAGKVSGSAGLTKTGDGTLVLANATNNFSGGVNVTRGVLSISADGQLGDVANKVVLNPTGATATLRVTDNLTFAVGGRQIKFGNASAASVIEVNPGKTFTLDTAFDFSAAAAAALEKIDNGTLAISANNTGWTGTTTIKGGVILVSHANALGGVATNTVSMPTVNNSGGNATGALHLTGGITLPNNISLGANITGSGINYGGVVRSVAGVNTLAGTIAHVNGVGTFWAAAPGATLNFAGVGTWTNSPTFSGGGTINFNAVPNLNAPTIAIIEGTTVNLTVDGSAASKFNPTQVIARNGAFVLSGAGKVTDVDAWSETYAGGLFLLDNSVTNVANRFNNRNISLNSGTFRLIVSPTAATSEISTRKLGGNYGFSIIDVDNTVGSQASTLQWSNFNDTNAGSTYDFRGAFGTSTNMIRFGSGGTFAHAAPNSRTSATGIIPRAIVNGTEWATYDSSSASAVGLRAFTGYSSAINVLSAASSAIFKATASTLNSLSGNQTLVALNLNTDAGAASIEGLGGLNPSSLTLTSGAVLVNGSGSAATLMVPIVTLGAEGVFHVAAGKTLTVTVNQAGSYRVTLFATRDDPGSVQEFDQFGVEYRQAS